MTNVTITVAKSDKGYRVVVVDDAKTADNADAWKANADELTTTDRDKVIEYVQGILRNIE